MHSTLRLNGRLLALCLLALAIVAGSSVGWAAESREESRANRWKYDVDVFYCPANAVGLGASNRYYYCAEEGRIWLEALVSFEHATDAYHARTSRLVVVSDDLGLTWTLWDGPWPGPVTGPVALPDGSIVEMANGGYERYPKSEIARLREQGYSVWDVQGADYCGIYYAIWMRRSTDGGRTWEEQAVHKRLPFFAHLVGFGGPRVLDDGTLVSFAYGTRERGGRTSSYILRSTDAGQTWSLVTMADGRDSPATEHIKDLDFRTGFTEIFPLFLGGGRMFVMLRTQLGGSAFQVVSNDFGKTWSKPQETPIRAKHPAVMRLRDGTILCTYQRRFARPYGVRARLTTDLGKTWSDEIVIRDDIPVSDGLANPYAIELSDGTLLTVFLAKKLIDGAPRNFLGASRWSRDPGREVAGESRWTRGHRWVPEIPMPPRTPKFNMDTRGKSPWQVERERARGLER